MPSGAPPPPITTKTFYPGIYWYRIRAMRGERVKILLEAGRHKRARKTF